MTLAIEDRTFLGAADRMISVDLLANGMVFGGMSYYVDPNLSKPSGGKTPHGKDCDGTAQKLMDCLKLACACSKACGCES